MPEIATLFWLYQFGQRKNTEIQMPDEIKKNILFKI